MRPLAKTIGGLALSSLAFGRRFLSHLINLKHFLIVLGFNDTSTLVGYLCLPEKGRKKIEEIVEEMKERIGKKEEQK